MFANRPLLRCIVIAMIAFGGATDCAFAQTPEPTDAEKALAVKIKCEDFKKNPDGSWHSGPNAMIGTDVFSNNTFGVHGIVIRGADVAVVLNQKCGGRPL
jgi:hypothetical protein